MRATATGAVKQRTLDLKREQRVLLNVASHELRTPLTSIRIYAQVLEHMTEEESQASRFVWVIRQMNQELEQYVELVNELVEHENSSHRR